MSFVEGISAGNVDVADPAFVLCIGGVVLLVSLLLAPPAIATALHCRPLQRGFEKLCWFLRALFGRQPKA